MPGQNSHTLASQRVPDIASPVIITSEKDTTRDRKCDRGDATEDVVMGETVQFAICSDVEQSAGGIIRTSGKSIAIREKPSEQDSETMTTSTTVRHTEQH